MQEMNSSGERMICTFDFRKYGKLTLTEKRLVGTIYSFQKTKQPQQQVGNTIAGNPGEVKVEHPIDATLDRISRINVNEGLLMGPVIYLWDAFVVLATIAAFRFIGNYMWSAVSWLQWFSLGMLYGIYWGHDWVRKWVNFHFMLDGAPYRVLVDKSRADEAERFVEAVRTVRATGFSSATPLQAEALRDKQIKIGMVIMSVGCVIALILACCSGGCGKSASCADGVSSVKKRSDTGMSAQTEFDCLVRQYLEINERKGTSRSDAMMAIDAIKGYAPPSTWNMALRGAIKELGEMPNPGAYAEAQTARCAEAAQTEKSKVETDFASGDQREPYDVLKAYMKSRHCSTTFSGDVKGKFLELTKDEQREVAKELSKLMSKNK